MKALFGGGSSSSSGSSDGASSSKYTLPPFPHPLPERLLSIHLTPEGLLILPSRTTQPSPVVNYTRHASPRTSAESKTEDVAAEIDPAAKRQSLSQSVQGAKVGWGRQAKVQATSQADVKRLLSEQEAEILCFGIIGLQRVFNDAYLLVITSRTLVGDHLHTSRPVYKSTGVLPIPVSYGSAKSVLQAESKRQQKNRINIESQKRLSGSKNADKDGEEMSDSDDVVTPSVISRDGPFTAKNGSASATVKLSGTTAWSNDASRRIASDGADPQEEQALSNGTDPPSGTLAIESIDKLSADQRWHEATKAELEEKVVKETARQYSRGEMWFSYDFDLTTPMQRKQDALDMSAIAKSKSLAPTKKSASSPSTLAEPSPTLPLWRRADRRFWHNEFLSRDFVDAGLHGLVLPLMQGFFQVTDLPLSLGESTPSSAEDMDPMSGVSEAAESIRVEAQLLIISRRSKERAGLRYQRRGVNEIGQVANYVETEQILSLRRGDNEHHTMSFLQFRGSIPQFWKQDPFSMKPPPILERNAEENRKACQKHFDAQVAKYGKVICINLAEQHGKEGAITKAYKDAVEEMNTAAVKYMAFDFHEECKGMHFENVSKLIDQVEQDRDIQEMDCFWKSVQSVVKSEKVHSRQKAAFRVSCLDCLDRTNVVQSAFARYMLQEQLQRLSIRREDVQVDDFDFAFNDSWANNGDMVSQIYAGTRALKGDFTRTGKRNLLGMMNDATNSVYRMVQGAVTDFFKQTVIDFQYGQLSLSALEKYNDDLAARDPSESHRLVRVRANAIESCARELLSEQETSDVTGWTLFSPIEPNRVQSSKLEEKVFLLTKKAIFVCGYDFTAEKLVEYSKIKLGDIVGIKRGVYILSPNEGYHPENHWGFVVQYINEERRLNTASMKNVPPKDDIPSTTSFVAFRAVVDETASTMSESSGASAAKSDAVRFSPFNKLRSSKVTAEEEDASPQPTTSHALVDQILSAILPLCADAGAFDEDDEEAEFLKEETIQSLAQAKANSSLFAPLIEGLKRRLWL